MTKHLIRSRVTKALTDAGLAASFADAEARLDAVRVCVVLDDDQARTPAGQAAALTALAVAYKCFGRVSLATNEEAAPLISPLLIGPTITDAARNLGGAVDRNIPMDTTHLVRIGGRPEWAGWRVDCWWDRWLAGTRADSSEDIGDSRLSLSGVFAGALAVRQIFASARIGPSYQARDVSISLWEPWTVADSTSRGPARFTAPNALWLVGLGHLGQAFVWNLLTLPYRQERRVVLQDDQRVCEENQATSLLVLAQPKIGERKVRLASTWLEHGGWETALIERRHRGELRPTADDPPFLLSGLDDLAPRKLLAGAGFDFMVDAGIGHGPGDFEGIQVRIIANSESVEGLWNASEHGTSKDRLLAGEAYQSLEREIGACGTFTIANASVAVPFVGAAADALAIAQLIRLASMQPGGALIQMDLASPEMMIDGGRSATPHCYLGGEIVDLDKLVPTERDTAVV